MELPDIFFRMKSLVVSDWKKPQEQLAHLDGSPYGSSGIKRLVMMPATKGFVLVAIFNATARELVAPDKHFIGTVAYAALCASAIYAYNVCNFNYFLSIPKDSVIDKTGENAGDPKASIRMQSHYFWQSFCQAGVAVSSAVLSYYTLKSPPAMELSNLAFIGWNLYARNKLAKQKWTIQTSPPALPEEEPLAQRLLEGLMPGPEPEPIPVHTTTPKIKADLTPVG